jgi:hypothetical protein
MMRKLNLIAIVLAAGTLLGCATPPAPPGLGETKETAVEVCKPLGQQAYLNRLICSDGTNSTYLRIARADGVTKLGTRIELPVNLTSVDHNVMIQKSHSYEPLKNGELDYHIVDAYEVICGSAKRVIYMDMYHCNQPPPSEIPNGFSLRK